MLSNCPEMLVFDTHWQTRHFVVREQTARAVTKWTRACDKRLARLISYIHHTSEFKHYCHVGSIAQQCRLGLVQDSDFAGDLEDSKLTSGGLLCIFGSHTFFNKLDEQEPNICLTQFNGSREYFSLDPGLRMDGIPALDLSILVIEVFHSSPNHSKSSKDEVREESLRNTPSNKHTQNQTKTPIQDDTLELCNVDYDSLNAKSSHFAAMFHVFED